MDADQFAFNWMEANPDQWPYSDLQRIIARLQEIGVIDQIEGALQVRESQRMKSSHTQRIDSANWGYVSLAEFREGIMSVTNEVRWRDPYVD